jgi:hypothetical protein
MTANPSRGEPPSTPPSAARFQDVRRRVAKVFVALGDTGQDRQLLQPERAVSKDDFIRLAAYAALSDAAAVLWRRGRSCQQGRGLEILLIDAIRRCECGGAVNASSSPRTTSASYMALWFRRAAARLSCSGVRTRRRKCQKRRRISSRHGVEHAVLAAALRRRFASAPPSSGGTNLARVVVVVGQLSRAASSKFLGPGESPAAFAGPPANLRSAVGSGIALS